MEFVSFSHKGLRGLFERGSVKGLDARQVNRLRAQLTELARASDVGDIEAPAGWRFHELKGDRKGTYSFTVTGNWRLTFRIVDGQIADVDLEDYH